jgi:hypothetical protein
MITSEICAVFVTTKECVMWIHTQGSETFKVLRVLSKDGARAKAARRTAAPSVL